MAIFLNKYPRLKSTLQKAELLWVFLFFCLSTIFMTWPLSLHLKTMIVGGMGDNIYFVWLIRWYQRVILEGVGHPFFNPLLNYPQGWNLSTTETSLASALPGVPISYLWGPISGYNAAMMITFVLSGFFMYLFVKDLTQSKMAAIISGTLYAFSPYHMAHFLVGHLNLCGIQWFPLFFWGIHRLLTNSQNFNLKFVIISGLSLACIAFTSMYYLYMTFLFVPVFLLTFLGFTKFKLLFNKLFWFQGLSTGAIAAPFIYFALRPFIQLSSSGTLASRSLEYASMYSASPTDFILPAADHFLLGGVLNKLFDRSLWNESSLYITLTTLVFAIIAIIFNRNTRHRTFIWSAAIVSIVSVILALGINLHWNNQNVVWQIPSFFQPIFHKTETLVYLPAAFLFEHFPFFDKMRTLIRFGFFALLFLPVLAGIGFAFVASKLRTIRKVAFAGLVFLFLIFEIYPGSYAHFMTEPQPRSVDLWLANQPNNGAVVQMPFYESSDQAQVYYTLFHQKPFLGGDFNANQPSQFIELQPILENFPDEQSIITLQNLGVTYIIVDKKSYSDFELVDQSMTQSGLERLAFLSGQMVYSLSQP